MSLWVNSVCVAAGATLGAVALGGAAAGAAMGLPGRWRARAAGLAGVALAMPPFLATNAWLDWTAPGGLLRPVLPGGLFSLGGAVWLLMLLLWPIPMLALVTAWRRVEREQLELEPCLRGLSLARHLLWPAARAELGLAAALVFVLALNNFTVPALLQVPVAPAEVWTEFNTNLDAAGAFKKGWLLWAAPAVLLFVWPRRWWNWPRVEGGAPAAVFRRRLGRGIYWGAAVAGACAIVISAGLPLAQLAGSPRTWAQLGPALRAGGGAAWNSLWLAAGTATLVTVLGAAAACARGMPSARLAGSGPGWGAQVLWLPFFVPGLFLGLAAIAVFNRPGWEAVYPGAGGTLLVFGTRYLAFGWFGAEAARRGVDPAQLDAGRMCGAGGWGLWRHLVWPQMAPQLGAISYLRLSIGASDLNERVFTYNDLPEGETDRS